jgi:hypothetical protein
MHQNFHWSDNLFYVGLVKIDISDTVNARQGPGYINLYASSNLFNIIKAKMLKIPVGGKNSSSCVIKNQRNYPRFLNESISSITLICFYKPCVSVGINPH